MTDYELKNLAAPADHRECLRRISQLTPETEPRWGTMTVAQMLAHCAEVVEVANGKELQGTPFYVKKLRSLVRRVILGTSPYRKNTGTHPQYRQTRERDFQTEKLRLLDAMERFAHENNRPGNMVHPFLGEAATREMGWGMYKHLDHHLVQFGATVASARRRATFRRPSPRFSMDRLISQPTASSSWGP